MHIKLLVFILVSSSLFCASTYANNVNLILNGDTENSAFKINIPKKALVFFTKLHEFSASEKIDHIDLTGLVNSSKTLLHIVTLLYEAHIKDISKLSKEDERSYFALEASLHTRSIEELMNMFTCGRAIELSESLLRATCRNLIFKLHKTNTSPYKLLENTFEHNEKKCLMAYLKREMDFIQ